MVKHSKKLFLIVALGSMSFVARPDAGSKESIEKFFASALVQSEQKESTATVKNLLNLFDQVVDGLKTGGEKLSQLTKAFYDLCGMLGQINEPRPHHIRELENKLEEIYVLISNDKDVSAAEKAVMENISAFINLFEEVLTNENLNLGGAAAKFVDLFFYRPLEFINQFKYGKEVVATTATTLAVALGAVVVWRATKSKQATNTVVPTPSSETRIDATEIAKPTDSVPATASSATAAETQPVSTHLVETVVPAEKPADTTSTVVPTPTPSVTPTPVITPSTTTVDTQPVPAPVTTPSVPPLKRQDAVGDLGKLIVEQQVEQSKQNVVAPVVQEVRSNNSRYPLRNTPRRNYGANKINSGAKKK